MVTKNKIYREKRMLKNRKSKFLVLIMALLTMATPLGRLGLSLLCAAGA